MTFASWLKHLPWVAARKTKPIRKSGQRRPSFKPHVEQLETRLAPATLTVTSDADIGTGTLRNQLAAASSGDTIQFAATLTGGTGNTIDLASVLSITKNVTIDGTGSTITVSGQNLIQVFNVGVTATIDNLSIIDGKAVKGGGIEVITGGNLTLTDVTITNCSATTGGAIYLKTGTLNVASSTFSSNTASSSGGVIYSNAGTFTASESTFSGNHATARSGGAVYSYHATTTLTNDTFSGNTSGTYGGAVYNHSTLTLTGDTFFDNSSTHHGGGLANLMTGGPTATVTDVTFYDNSAQTGGAIYQQSGGNLHLVSDTIAGNPASSQGGGLYINGGNVTTFNSILDGNTATKGPDVYLSAGTFTSSGGNLYGNTSGVTWKTISTVGALYPDVHDAADNPKLNSLAPNGGYTQTMAPLSGSPALGAGNPVTNTLATDQRGFLRVVNNKIDIGAYENQNQFFTLSPPSSNNVGANSWNLGSFSEAPSLGNWSVSVSWGDGATTSFTTSSQGSLGTRTHYYASATNYTITVTITDADGNFSSMSFGVTGGPLVVNTLNDLSHAVGYPIPTSPLDSKGNISLRSALDYVNYYNLPGTIDFTSGLSGTIGLTNALHNLQITDTNSLTIDGTGASITVSGAGLSGISRGGVFFINTTSSVTINDLAIIDGTSSAEGGGIYHSNGNLTLTNDTIESNTATNNSGGGIYSDGGTLTLRNDTIASNVAKNNGADGGGVCSTGGNLTVTNCSVVHNTASGSGGGIAFVEIGSITLTDDTIADNSAGGAGGGVFLSLTGGGSANFTNITITGNSALQGGGIYNAHCALTLDNATLNDNAATSTGGGIYSTGTGGSLTTFNSILDGNTKTSGGIFVSYSDVNLAGGTFTSSGRNLYGKTASNVTWNTTGSFQDVPDPNDNPNLGALQKNGGTTQTMAELPGSPALNAGSTSGVTYTTDQRGFSRTSTIGTNTYIDIGAFQNQSQLFTVNSAASEPNPTVGQSTAFNLGSFSYTGSAINLWTVTINWGDGSANSVFTTSSQGNLGTLNHTYATLGNNKTFTVFVADAYGNFGQATSPTFNIVPPTSIGTNTIAVVTTTLDLSAVNPSLSPLTTNGNVSLRSALQYANTNNLAGTIYFQAGLTGINDIGSTGGTYFITDISGLAIDASGANFTVNGDNMVQDFFVNPGTLVAIKNLSIIDGNNPSGSGGGVYNAGNLTLDNDTISGNSANKNGGAVYLYTKGNLTLNNDILSGNKATNSGGAVYNDSASLTLANDILSGNKAGNSGGAIYNSAGNLTVTGGAITGNKTTGGGGGGIYFFGGTETISDTTVANNAAIGYFGGGIYNSGGNVSLTNDTISGNSTPKFEGGGIYNFNGPMVVSNSTIAGNSAANSGGGIANSAGNLTLINDTIAYNSGNRNAGVYNNSSGTVTIKNSIVDGNTGTGGDDVYNSSGGVFTSSGGNLYGSYGPTAGSIHWITTGTVYIDRQSNNPLLGGLQNNGGPTQTIALLPGSPALGNANPSFATSTDQRGFPRPAGGPTDIGAYQNQSQLLTLTAPSSEPNPIVGQSTAFNLGSFTYTGSASNVWTVTVNWGDGTSNSVFSTTNQGTLPTQSHTYSTVGIYTLTITLTDLDNNFSQTNTGTVTVGGPVTVNTLTDKDAAPGYTTPFTSGGLVTLRSALEYFNTNNVAGTIGFKPGLNGTIGLTLGNLQITDTKSLTIDGSGASITVSGASLSGITKGGVFFINTTASDAIDFLTIAGGKAQSGGGVYLSNGNLFLTNDTVSGNTGQAFGGGIENNDGTVTLTNDFVSQNMTSLGGGIAVSTADGNLTVVNSTIAQNLANSGGGIFAYGSTTITNSTIAYNTANDAGGGIYNQGGDLKIGNATIAFNSVDINGGSGGGIYNNNTPTTGSLHVVNTIVDGNTVGSAFGDIYNTNGGVIFSTGGNLFGAYSTTTPISGPFTYDGNDNPGLGFLQNNGGPTPTMAELPPGSPGLPLGSPALNGGITTSGGLSLVLPPTDQRGVQRVVNGTIDIGAFEDQSQLFNLTPPTTEPTVDVGQSAAFNLGSFTYSGNAGNVWTVDVNWGDGTPANPDITTFTVTRQGSLGTLTHTYETRADSPYTIQIAVTDANGNFASMSSPGVIVEPDITISSNPLNLPAGLVGSSYNGGAGATFTATGGSSSGFIYTATGNTDGLTLTGNKLGGVPSNPGTFSFTITAQDSNGGTGSQTYTLNVSAPSLVVTNTNDSGAGSLRQAMSNAINYYTNGTITFAPGVTGIITLASALPQITSGNLTIQGTGAGVLTVSGNNQNQVFAVEGGTTVSISGLTVSGGRSFNGGGIFINTGGNLTLTNDVIANNSTTNGEGAGIDNKGTLTLINDTLANNTSADGGGGLANLRGANATLTNVTVANNSAINFGGGITNDGSVTLDNVTLAGNQAPSGAGIFNNNDFTSSLTLYDTIVAGNAGVDVDKAGSGTFTSKGHNLYGTSSGIGTGGAGNWQLSDIQTTNPGLGILQNNGGPTPTIDLLPGSPALAAGNTAGVTYTTDQRGFQRIVNNKIDIGAFENQGQLFTFNPASLPAGAVGSSYVQLISANGGSGGYNFSVSAGSLPTGLSLSSNGLLTGTPSSTNGGSPFAFTVQVTDSNSDTVTQNYSVTINPGPPATFSLFVTAGNNQSTLANTSFATSLAVTVKDQFGNLIPNVPVQFAAPTAGPGGGFSGSTIVLTNSNGVATAPIFTANIFAGTYIVTASTTGVSSPAKFTLSNLSSLGTSANAMYVHNVYALLLNRLPDSGAQGWVALLNQATPPATVVQDIERTTEYLNDVVKGLYLHYLQRPADTNGLNGWTRLLAGGGTIEQVIDGLVASPEYFALHGNNNLQFVQALYTDILGRPGSSSEWQAWVNALNSGVSRAQVGMDFLTSTEYRIDLVDSYYLEYLRRPADTVGQAAWVQALAAGVSDQAVLAGIFGSAEGYAKWS